LDAVPFTRDTDPPVRGFLHRADATIRPSADNSPNRYRATADAIVLTHGAGSNCQAPLLTAIAKALAEAGITVLRCDLPYRQKRPHGPPFPGEAARDRQGLQNAVEAVRADGDTLPGGVQAGAVREPAANVAGAQGHAHQRRIFLGGHSYGGRQASMLAAEYPSIASGLLLMSYPLHPPGQLSRLRTDHFPSLRADALFVHGTRDPFASTEELEQGLKLIPARTLLLEVDGGGHDLRAPKSAGDASPLPQRIVEAFLGFF
jgi:predicted alpha/beta-hydrolase family hydrolase